MADEEEEERNLSGKESELNMHERLRVLSLNCWGIPYISSLKKERFHAIGQELNKGNYDIVSLQEVWDKNDYETLSVVLENVFPYSYYFYGGVIGTGKCIFSRYPILNTFMYPFALSGYPHAISHGDWFGGKAACFALIDHPKMKIHFFTSHLHAEYDRTSDTYLAHRAVQAYHLAKLINQLTDHEDFVILCGDMNSEPVDPCYHILKQLPQLQDSWVQCHGQKGGYIGNTSDRSENSFTPKKYHPDKLLGSPEDGKRIDYVFYRSLDERWLCQSSCVAMGKVPGKNFSFSDHDGIAATFDFKGKPRTMLDLNQEAEMRKSVLSETKGLIKNQLKEIDSHFYQKLLLIVLLFAFVLLPVVRPADADSIFNIQGILGKIVFICRILITIFCSGYAWILIINQKNERHVYRSVCAEIDLQLRYGHTVCKVRS